MLSNTLRNDLKEGKAISGCTVSLFAPELVEMLALSGFDFAFIDAEHGPLSEREVQTMIMAADVVGMACLVRVPANDPRVILRYMDTGAAGIIVPDIESKAEAENAIKAVKYEPHGIRGLSTTRAAWYGQKMPLGEYTKYANDKSVVICQIESKKGVENVKEIISAEHLDGIFIGTTDLSNSLGVAGQRNNPQVNEAVDYVVKTAKAADKAYGAMVRAGESPKVYIEEGYQITVASGNGFFTGGAKQFIKEFKA